MAFSEEQSQEIFRRLSAEKSDQIVQAMIKENFHKKKVFAKKMYSGALTDNSQHQAFLNNAQTWLSSISTNSKRKLLPCLEG